MTPMNAAQVKALFEREAVLFETEDRVPSFRAAALFGQGAVDHARNLNAAQPGKYENGFGIGTFTLYALTFKGFQAAASYYNVQQLREAAGG